MNLMLLREPVETGDSNNSSDSIGLYYEDYRNICKIANKDNVSGEVNFYRVREPYTYWTYIENISELKRRRPSD